jgi:chromosome segregation protein
VAGDLLGAHWAHGGSARPQSLLDVRAACDEAASRLGVAEAREEVATEALALAQEAQDAARQSLEETRGLMQAADAAAAEISGRLGRFAGAARAAADEAKRLDAAVGAARRSAEKDLTKLAALKTELAEAEAVDERARDPELEDQLAEDEREEMGQRCTTARNTEMEARLEVRTVEERLRAIGGRADSLSAAAAAERTARERAAARRRQRASAAAVAKAVAAGAAVAVDAAESSLAQADGRRREAEAASAGGAESLKTVRARVGTLSGELDKVVNTAHGAEIARAEHRLRLEQMAAHAADEFGVQPDVLVAEYGPDQPVPVASAPEGRRTRKTAAAGEEPATVADALRAVTEAARAESDTADDGGEEGEEGEPGPAGESAASARPPEAVGLPAGSGGDDPPEPPRGIPYVREEQEQRAAAAERQLARLGKVNPLALEEYAALQERHQFLATQLEDLRKTRRDLLTVVKEVDDRVQEVFASAYADTAREFEGLFARLFPGGAGRLLLTEPDDMLTTGIEIEARPPGKKVKRLSLLSGGERSLTAIAYLFAIFKARPSPFYVLDEVEAALDDSNLQRLLGVFEELRESSQLIVITHQRRTMEAADALYGVTMRGDGVSTVISQRVREVEPA